MAKDRDIRKIKMNKENAIALLISFLEKTFQQNPNKADKLSYWIRDYVNYLIFEDNFIPEKLQRYKRGDIIKVDFGFRLGSELGGLHYCVVLDNNNHIKSTTITVLPLSSVKLTDNLQQLPKDRVYLGTELLEKVEKRAQQVFNRRDYTITQMQSAKNQSDIDQILKTHDINVRMVQRIYNEFKQMKQGSIALVGQIATVSKMRIYDPKNTHSVLHGIRLSPEKLDLINKKLKELYIFDK